MIKGIQVTLYEKNKTGEDAFGHPIYEESPVTVENVLVAPASASEVLNTQNLTGSKAIYNIAIPKGDTHTWEGNRIDFFGQSWRVIALPQMGIENMIPLDWNKKYMVERYE